MKNTLSIVKEKRFRLFSLSLLVAIVAWFIINLSKIYTEKVKVVVELANVEKGYELSKYSDSLEVTIEASGLVLLNKSLKELKYQVDVTKFNDNWSWKNDQYNFKKLFSDGVDIKSVTPSTIDYQKTKLISKSILINDRIELTTKLGYGVSNQELSHKSIEVFGNKDKLALITSVNTEELVFTNVSDSITGKIALEKIEGVRFAIDSVSYKFNIEQYTQGEFKIPVLIKNIPLDKDISIFPKEVTLQFQSPISVYSSLISDQFQVSVDASYYQDSELLQISLDKVPEVVKEVKLLKKAVNFIVIDK